MKKFITMLAVAIISAAGVFANVELGEKFYFTPVNDTSVVMIDSPYGIKGFRLSNPVGLGFDTEANFFFGSPCNFIDLGMNVSIGADFGDKASGTNGWHMITASNQFVFDVDFIIGPVIRFNVGTRHSFVITPGFRINVFGLTAIEKQSAEYTSDTLTFLQVGINLGLGYRFWIVNAGGFHMGLSLGSNLSFTYFGIANETVAKFDSSDRSLKSKDSYLGLTGDGFKAEFSIGIVFNFGDRSVEKFTN